MIALEDEARSLEEQVEEKIEAGAEDEEGGA